MCGGRTERRIEQLRLRQEQLKTLQAFVVLCAAVVALIAACVNLEVRTPSSRAVLPHGADSSISSEQPRPDQANKRIEQTANR